MDLLPCRRPPRRARRPFPRLRIRPHVVGCPAYLLATVAALGLLAGSRPAAAATGPGAYGWPVGVPHAVVRGFEAPASAWGAGHRGVDLGAPAGSSVVAAGSGTVTFAAVLAGRGVVVVTHRGGLRTTYEPVVPSVRIGAQVTRGDPLGRLALTGGHCLPRACLHWGALRGSTYLDPLGLLGLAAASIRLLPLGPGGDTAPEPGGDGGPGLGAGSALDLLPLSSGAPTVAPIGATPASVAGASQGSVLAMPRSRPARARTQAPTGASPTVVGPAVGAALGGTALLGAAVVRGVRRRAPPRGA